jgi:hypothetical protein
LVVDVGVVAESNGVLDATTALEEPSSRESTVAEVVVHSNEERTSWTEKRKRNDCEIGTERPAAADSPGDAEETIQDVEKVNRVEQSFECDVERIFALLAHHRVAP